MKLPWIIEHLTDVDFYTYTQMSAIIHQFPDLDVEFKFKCRNKGIKFTQEMVDEIIRQIEHVSTLKLVKEEVDFFKSKSFFKASFIEFVRAYQPDMNLLDIKLLQTGELDIRVKGLWSRTLYWEEPILSIVNEVYFRHAYTPEQYSEILAKCEEELDIKVESLRSGQYVLGGFTDFGTRRRLSREWQEKVVARFATSDLGETKFLGTSNVWLAIKYGIKAVGTNAHQWYQAGQGIKEVPLAHTNAYMLDAWVREYRSENGMALTDCLGTDHFLKDFDMYHAKLWDGVRNDSGDPFAWGDKIIAHYEGFKIDPKSKSVLFSNSLDFELADKLYKYFKDQVKVGFGIGTYLTGVQKFTSSWGEDVVPLNIVVKMVTCNGRPVAKLSDDIGKGMCEDPDYVKYLEETITRWYC